MSEDYEKKFSDRFRSDGGTSDDNSTKDRADSDLAAQIAALTAIVRPLEATVRQAAADALAAGRARPRLVVQLTKPRAFAAGLALGLAVTGAVALAGVSVPASDSLDKIGKRFVPSIFHGACSDTPKAVADGPNKGRRWCWTTD